jgi:hypothetical protein
VAAVTDAPPRHNPDYLAKDYDSFRSLLLDHLAASTSLSTSPDVASVESALVEVLAYVGDNLSYFQDAVATEAYLATARQRVSVRRHARLLDYRLNEGCSARVWACLETAADDVPVPRGTALLTRIKEVEAVRVPRGFEASTFVFETMHDVLLVRAHNRMALHDPATPPRPGDTAAKLAGSLERLAAGDVLIFRHLPEGRAQAVRLISAEAKADWTEIAWQEEDAFPAAFPDGGSWTILGNVVLADHGQSFVARLPEVPREGLAELSLPFPDLSFGVPYQHAEAVLRSAAQTMEQDPRAAEPMLSLRETAAFLDEQAIAGRQAWTGARDLVHAAQFDRSFAVEPSGGPEATLRFGDGVHGRRLQPDWTYFAHYRSGRGARGNIGPGTLAHVVTADDRILGISNPLPGSGGADPETLAEARMLAPFASADLRRCVTADDYVSMTEAFPDVLAAVASRDWNPTGSVVSIAVRRTMDRAWDEAFAARLRSWLDPLRMIGDRLELSGPRYVRPDVAMELSLASGRAPTEVAAAVRDRLAGLQFGFGERVDPARLAAAVREVPGVAAVQILRLSRDGSAAAASIEAAPDEIVRLDPGQISTAARSGP